MRHFDLSPSTLGLFKNCPRCFWLHINRGHRRPNGIFPSLPGGMDLVIKKYFDKYRGSLPPEIDGKVRGTLFADTEKLRLWRFWKTSLKLHIDNATLYGAFDDVLVDGNLYIPLDYKTRGSAPKDETNNFYEHQLDLYALLLEGNGYKTDKEAYLVYYFPLEVSENGVVRFEVEPKKVEIDTERGKKLFLDAIALLDGSEPESHQDCEFCNYAKLADELG